MSITTENAQERVQELIDFILEVANPLGYVSTPSLYNEIFNKVETYQDVYDTPFLDADGYTPITYCHVPRIVDKMLRHGVDLQRKDANGDPILYNIIMGTMCTENELLCVRLMVNHTYAASTSFRKEDIRHPRSFSGQSAIHLIYNKELYQLLIKPTFVGESKEEKRAYLRSVDHKGRNALHTLLPELIRANSKRVGGLEVIKETVLSYELQNIIEHDKKSDKVVSMYQKRFDAWKAVPAFDPLYLGMLCEEGVPVDHKDHDGNTPLHLLFEWLIRTPDVRFDTAHITPYLPYLRQAIQVLLDNHANMYTLRSASGKTCLDMLLQAHRDAHAPRASLPPSHPYTSFDPEYRKALFSLIDELYTTLYRCRVCHATGKLKKCSGCEQVFYCSPEHQRADWKDHKAFCRAHPVQGTTNAKRRGGTRRGAKGTRRRRSHGWRRTRRVG